MKEKEFKEKCAKILQEHIKFSGQTGDYVIHGALDALWKLHSETNVEDKVDKLSKKIDRLNNKIPYKDPSIGWFDRFMGVDESTIP